MMAVTLRPCWICGSPAAIEPGNIPGLSVVRCQYPPCGLQTRASAIPESLWNGEIFNAFKDCVIPLGQIISKRERTR